ncbi:DUF2164 domain-containing protein [Reinekea marinisedimentorum]|uniref:Uncharacterized protein (DUF2164 family) n=1 Tax=Reinekea marinisedimentorum TaxID=230495 RepID=A0A4R3IDU4_9GAMM|nr:DUF2164 domain-containing protein [Reinekea marinisedimentorum]TCS43917.1 uncharacterized protein (DUF2164 family) [Reinekea marinisedimentorum]
MPEIKFTTDEKAQIVKKVQLYFSEELDQTIGQFDAEFLIDFFAEEVGAYFYNKGIYDAQQVVEERIEQMKDAFYDIEMPTTFRK